MKSDLINGKPVKSIILFALPIMLSSMLQYNYNLVDNIIVGRFVGTDAPAAGGNVGSINGFIIGTSLGLTSGFTISVAQAYGARKFDKMNKYAGNSITLAFVIGMVIMIVAHFLSRPLLKAIDTPDDIIDMFVQIEETCSCYFFRLGLGSCEIDQNASHITSLPFSIDKPCIWLGFGSV